MAHFEGRYTPICASRWDRADEVEPSRVEPSRLVGSDSSRADLLSHRRADGGGRHSSQYLRENIYRRWRRARVVSVLRKYIRNEVGEASMQRICHRVLDATGHNGLPAPHLIATTIGNGSPHQDIMEFLAPVREQRLPLKNPKPHTVNLGWLGRGTPWGDTRPSIGMAPHVHSHCAWT